ncbi:Mammalian cell entry related domain protein [Mycolicibacterium fortuitum]|uniref:Mammalian cell entry related domain protein n=1 Tax=Mycolicibacterium fortuitum TaxID=1766 RepID=A0ABD6QD08_MYCFO|nr:Mammalian cell entry related domain protein [Mycolicibacterium fortuitum]OMC34271.1 Mammalian cell entry related domain protein [Mycolicibacterium fortuitum]
MSADAEARRLTIIGLVVVLVFTAVCTFIVVNPFRDDRGRMSVVLDMPFVGQGIATGSPLMMHGVSVGNVTNVSSLAGGGVRVLADLESRPVAGLTDTLGVDFRPANYFGVTGINLIAGEGGRPLQAGSMVNAVPSGNFTLQALLSRMGEITDGVVTPQLVSVINRATSYTDGLNPLIESMVMVAQAVDNVQTVSTTQLMRNATGISAAFPAFVSGATATGYGFNQDAGYVFFRVSGRETIPGQEVVAVPGERVSQDFWDTRARETLDFTSGSFFGALGRLLSSHAGDLKPAVGLVKTLSDTVPALVTPVGINDMMVELRRRFETMYAGSPEQRAVQVHIILDQIPGVQAPVNAMGGP